MRKLSDLIKESEGSKTYKALVTVKIEVTVTASSEGDAGYKIDAEVAKIPGVISHDIDEIEETQTNAINKDLTFDENDEPKTVYGTEHLEEQGASLGNYVMSTDKLMRDEIYCIVDTGIDEWNGGYKFVGTNTESLDQVVYTFEDALTSPMEENPETFEFTEDEMQEMIDLKQIAFDGNKFESKTSTSVDTSVVDETKVAAIVESDVALQDADLDDKIKFAVSPEQQEAFAEEFFNLPEDKKLYVINKVADGINTGHSDDVLFIIADKLGIPENELLDIAGDGDAMAKIVIDKLVNKQIGESNQNVPSVETLYTSFIQINKDAITNGEDAVELTDTAFYTNQIYNIYFEDAVLVDKTISEADAEAKAKELAEEMSKYAVEQGTIL